MPTLSLRPAVPYDYPVIIQITEEAYLGAGYFSSANHPYMRELRDIHDRANRAKVMVVEDDASAEIVAAVTLARAGEPYADIALPDELEVRILVVRPQLQGRGIGRGVMDEIAAYAKTADIKTLPRIAALALSTGDNWRGAHSFYRSLGFVRQEKRDWQVFPEGIPTWLRVYRKEL